MSKTDFSWCFLPESCLPRRQTWPQWGFDGSAAWKCLSRFLLCQRSPVASKVPNKLSIEFSVAPSLGWVAPRGQRVDRKCWRGQSSHWLWSLAGRTSSSMESWTCLPTPGGHTMVGWEGFWRLHYSPRRHRDHLAAPCKWEVPHWQQAARAQYTLRPSHRRRPWGQFRAFWTTWAKISKCENMSETDGLPAKRIEKLNDSERKSC